MKSKLLLLIFIAGCSFQPNNNDDTDLESKTKSADHSSCAGIDPDNNDYFYQDYVKGPYGMKGNICWLDDTQLNFEYTPSNDTIHNFCKRDLFNELHCLKEFNDQRYDYVILNVSSLYCPACGLALKNQKKFIGDLRRDGLNIGWVTIEEIEEEQDIKTFYKAFNIDGLVLFDSKHTASNMLYIDHWPKDLPGIPMLIVFRTSDMKVMFNVTGWPAEEYYESWLTYFENFFTFIYLYEEKD
jgi:hypothetical protein